MKYRVNREVLEYGEVVSSSSSTFDDLNAAIEDLMDNYYSDCRLNNFDEYLNKRTADRVRQKRSYDFIDYDYEIEVRGELTEE